MKHKQTLAAFGLVACALAFTACEKTEDSKKVGDHYAVDMGLSVRWATVNVGAISPSDYGDHYAWGETKTKDSYSWDTYTRWKKADKNTYAKPADYFVGSVNLTDEYIKMDVAHKEWGSKWRMPTKAEFEELLDTNNCVWKETTENGVNGYKVKSRITKKSIFLPFAGCRFTSSDYNDGNTGSYWTSESNGVKANCVTISGYDNLPKSATTDYLFYGKSVRPVTAGTAAAAQ